jgi:hypothetical protein
MSSKAFRKNVAAGTTADDAAGRRADNRVVAGALVNEDRAGSGRIVSLPFSP